MINDKIYHDPDPQETKDWLESLEGVIKNEGPEKADLLLNELTDSARNLGVNTSPGVISPYVNSPLHNGEVSLPADDSIVAKNVAALVRWNAMAMVAKANKKDHSIGGHIASFASSSAIYEVGFNWFFKGPDSPYGADMVFFQGHSAPGMYARAFVEGRLTEDQLDNFRREVGGKGLSSYPHPYLMPHFWQFPTVSMGLGPMMAIYQARFMKYLEAREFKEVGDRKVWVFMGDGESDEPESLGALSLAAREKLDNLIFVVNCNLQRLDGPVRGNGKIIQELEGRFRGAGWNVIKVIWGSEWDSILEKDKKGILLKKLSAMVDGEFQTIQARGAAYLREKIFGDDPYLQELIADKTDKDLWQLTRGGHDPRKIYKAFHAASEHKDQPTVILFKTVKGYGMGKSGEASMGTHNQKGMSSDSLVGFRDHYDVPLSDDKLDELPFIMPNENSPEAEFLRRRRKAMGGPIPYRQADSEILRTPPLKEFSDLLEAQDREISTTMVYVRLLTKLVKDKEIGRRIVPIVPDEARTFGMEGLFRQIGIYSPVGQLYEPQDSDSLMWYREDVKGQILEEGITEAGAISSWIAAGTSYSNNNVPMIPFYSFYSMFGLQRVGDFAWAAGDSRTKGFLMAATAGRTTINGEGLQHEDGHGLMIAATLPTCHSYDPTFSYELAVIIQDGLKRMFNDDEDIFYYITLMNENYTHPQMPKGVEEGIKKGAYLFQKGSSGDLKVQLMGSGTILREVIEASKILKDEFNVDSDIWSVLGINELNREAIEAERFNRLHPQESPKVPYLTKIMENHKGPVVISTDYIRSYPEQIRRLLPTTNVTILGTDGYGRSDTRGALRSFFEVDRYHIALSALQGLVKEGLLKNEVVSQAIEKFGINAEKPSPLYH